MAKTSKKISVKTKTKKVPAASMKKVFWAVDIFGDAKQHLPAYKFVQQLKNSNFDVHPGYVLGASGFSIEKKKKSSDYFAGVLKKDSDRFFKELGAAQDFSLEVVHGHALRTRTNADKLVEYSKKKKFSGIIVSARAKHNFIEMLLGSFAESLINGANQPVFVVGSKVKQITEVKKIILATDFGKKSISTFKRSLKLAEQFKAKIDVLCLADSTMEKKCKATFAQWKKLADESGVTVEFLVESVKDIIPNDILQAAEKRGSDLIVLGGRRSGYRTHLLGSIPRFIARMSEKPVLIFPEA